MSVHDTAQYAQIKELLGIPEEEPIFILRGQDRLAIRAIEEYNDCAFEACNQYGMESTDEWETNMFSILGVFRLFAKAHADRMKFPD